MTMYKSITVRRAAHQLSLYILIIHIINLDKVKYTFITVICTNVNYLTKVIQFMIIFVSSNEMYLYFYRDNVIRNVQMGFFIVIVPKHSGTTSTDV